jgi:glycerol kinase
MLMPKPMWAEQDAEAILSVIAAMRDAFVHANASGHEMAVIGFSAACRA